MEDDDESGLCRFGTPLKPFEEGKACYSKEKTF